MNLLILGVGITKRLKLLYRIIKLLFLIMEIKALNLT